MSRIKKLMENKFIRGGSFLTVSTILSQVISFIFINIYVVNIMPAVQLGNFGLYLRTLSILNIIGTVNLSSSIMRGKFEFENEFDSFFKSIIIVGIVFSAISSSVFMVAIIIIKELGVFETSYLSIPIIVFMGIHSIMLFLYNCNMNKLTATYKHKEFAIIDVLKTLITVTTVIIFFFVFNWDTYIERVAGTVLTMVGFSIFFLIKNRKTKFKFKKEYLIFATTYSIPLILHSLSTTILNYFDSFVLKGYEVSGHLDAGTQGVYTYAYSIVMIISTIWTILNKLWTPWFFEKMREKDTEKIKKVAEQYVVIFSFLFFAFLMAVPEMKFFLKNKSFSHAFIYIPIAAAGFYFLFLYSFLSNTEFYHKNTKYFSLGAIIAGVSNIVLNLIFIPIYGDIAAAITTLISYVILFLYHILINDFILKNKIFSYTMYLKGIILMGLSVFTYYSLLEYTLIRWGILMVTTGVIYIIYRRKISWLN
ncbi:lipopolysaccharide biosynthesis protein [Oceanirhabdus seepicola]|uniref:Oligosaccharide flippase family protein n=1 Tax=Oceanirhabdus seepicola TaxID=2828781 RepID=A0A9J6P971_9CLOT|nr:oligosaccharide flippase family protein [Oceanirhabdus seepicola]MCM1992494.1 oligosaccharide flippase family protein [Oceanirhabdus seepicola]